MPLRDFSCRDFRCLRAAEFAADPDFSLIYGANASGKTSLLEAVAYLGRGRSFRNAATDSLIRHGEREFLLHGIVIAGEAQHRVGVRNGRAGLELSVDGKRGGGIAELATTLPLQVIDPDIHNLVAGGPEERRRFLDWVGFHVEHGFLDRWRRFRRVLKQRNAVLRTGAGGLESWDREFVAAAVELHEARGRVFDALLPAFESTAAGLLGDEPGLSYLGGWDTGEELGDLLRAGRDRDEQAGSTQQGPQRADLRLRLKERMARKLVSRGQQKLLACAMILAAAEVVQRQLDRRLLLLMDDPAAELDRASLTRLMSAVEALDCQVIATALTPESGAFPDRRALFHVEQGTLKSVP